jgi:hypothetical protein
MDNTCCNCHRKRNEGDRQYNPLLINKYDNIYGNHTYICTECHEVDRRGKCSVINLDPDWDDLLLVPRRCTSYAVYQDPPCCADHIRCSKCRHVWGCEHEEHPSYIFNDLCSYCFEEEEAVREAEWKRYVEKCIEEEQLAKDTAADQWAQEQTAYDREAGIRHCRVGRVST